MQNTGQYLLYIILVLVISGAVVSCGSEVERRMDEAEALFDSAPDSALQILREIPGSDLRGASERARHALLLSMALDKNYIDTTTFDVLRPALDYYPKHGTPDERLRTLFYQGRIYDNAGVYDSAMMCFVKASQVDGHLKDSMTMANNMVLYGMMALRYFDLDTYINETSKAAAIFCSCEGKEFNTILSLSYALRGCIMKNDTIQADSIAAIFLPLFKLHQEYFKQFCCEVLHYYTRTGKTSEMKELLAMCDTIDPATYGLQLARANAYASLGQNERALDILDSIPREEVEIDSLTYLAVEYSVLDNLGQHKRALESLKRFTRGMDAEDFANFEKKLAFIRDREEMELERRSQVHRKEQMIMTVCLIALSLCLIIVWLYYRNRLSRHQVESLHQEKAKLELERENMELKFQKLESEKSGMVALLEQIDSERAEETSAKKLSESIRKAIVSRINILNSLLAQEITSNINYGKDYDALITTMHNDKDGFMVNLKDSFVSSHPHFMSYLKSAGLTDRELDFACLYAIGLSGKEIGDYLGVKGHYNVSSSIRSKLSLSSDDTNLSLFIRKKVEEEFGGIPDSVSRD